MNPAASPLLSLAGQPSAGHGGQAFHKAWRLNLAVLSETALFVKTIQRIRDA
jgi:hypothetical protein